MKILLNIPLFWALVPIILLRWYAHVYLKKHRHCRFMFQKSRPCHTTTPPFLEIANPRFLHTKICAVVVLLVGVIKVPVPPFPEGSGHFIQELTLCPRAQHKLPQTLPLGSWLLPQLLLITRLSGENTHTFSRSLQTHKHSPTAQQTWINIPLSGKWESLYRVF